MTVLNIIVGAVLLLFGRRLFWLFVACVGFVVGANLTTQGLSDQFTEGTILIIALVVGFIGAIISVFLQNVVVRIAGFLAAGYCLYSIALEYKYDDYAWVAFLIGGIVGALLVMVLFNWALILLSSLMGAVVIAQNVALDQSASTILCIVLLIFGIMVQAGQMKGKEEKQEQRDLKQPQSDE
jgi:MFS family permease